MTLTSADVETSADGKAPGAIGAAITKGSYAQNESGAHASGKYLAWSILSAAFFLAFFQRAAPGVLVDQFMSDFHVGGAAIGLLASIYLYTFMAMQIPAGLLADTVGPARTVAFGSLAVALGALLFSGAHTITVAYIARFLVGLGASVAFICVLKAQALWIEPAAFVTMSGLLSIIGTLGSIVAATPLSSAVSIFGWRPAFAASAGASFVVAFLIWFFIIKDDKGRNARHVARRPSLITTSLQVIRNRQTWLCSIMHFGWLGTYITFTGLWGIPYLMQVYGLDRLSASNAMVWASMAFTVGTFSTGVISGRFLSRRKPILITAACVHVVMWLLIVILPPALLPSRLAIAVVICASLASSVCVLNFAIAKESNPPSAAGLAMAFTDSGILCGGLLQVLMGYNLDHGWQGQSLASGARIYPVLAYQHGYIAFVVVALTTLFAAVLIREDDQAEPYNE